MGLRQVFGMPLFLMRRNSILRADGWLRSVLLQRSVGPDGEPIPWITYPALRFLDGRVDDTMSVFEFGAGASTHWWARRVASVVAVEHDPGWHTQLQSMLPPNAECLLRTDSEGYVSAVDGAPRFDIIVVDGRWRVSSAEHAVSALREGGVIVWDNTDRQEYASGLDHLRALGFRRIDFFGQAPQVAFVSCTSVLYRPDNCLGI